MLHLRVTVVAILCSLLLSTTHARADMTIPANGRITLEAGGWDRQCQYSLNRGDEVIPLLLVETHQLLGVRRLVLAPRKHLAQGTYLLARRCAEGEHAGKKRLRWLGTGRPTKITSTGKIDLTPPFWVEPPEVISRSRVSGSCGNSYPDGYVSFHTMVGDDSPVWMRARVWGADDPAWSFIFPIRNDRTYIGDRQITETFPTVNGKPWHASVPWHLYRSTVGAQFSPGSRHLVLLCVVDAANNETCAPGPPLSFIGPTVCDDKALGPRVRWCRATPTPTLEPLTLTATTSLVPLYSPSTIAMGAMGSVGISGLAWMLLYWRTRKRHRIEQTFGRFGNL